MALSRARLGLYILGRRAVFEACYELRPAFELLLQRPDKLTLATGEMWPSQRVLADEAGKEVAGESVMEGVEHLGQFVFEMTRARVAQLREEQGLPPPSNKAALEPPPLPTAESALSPVAESDEVPYPAATAGESEDEGDAQDRDTAAQGSEVGEDAGENAGVDK